MTGDVNGDGHLDVLTGLGGDSADILLGDGTGGFTVGSMSGSFNLPNRKGAVLADANGDGFDDLFVSTRADPLPPPPPVFPPVEYRMMLNNGGTGFGSPTTVHSVPTSGELHFSTPWMVDDIDGDGLNDLVITQVFGIVVRLGDGAGSFGNAVTTSLPVIPLGPPQLADLDTDGHRDLVVPGGVNPGGPSAALAVFWGNGTAALGTPTVLPSVIPGTGFSGVWPAGIGDVDGDGHLDIAGVSCTTSSPVVSELGLLLGDGARGFAAPAQRDWPDDVCSTRLAVANFDGDGFDDVLEASSIYEVVGEPPTDRRAFVRFGGPGAELTESAFVAGVGDGTVTADVDADGKPDLITPTDDGIRVFLNRWDGRP